MHEHLAHDAVAFGEDNTTPYDGGPKAGNEFPLVCPMDMPAEARWMWFDPAPGNPAPTAASLAVAARATLRPCLTSSR